MSENKEEIVDLEDELFEHYRFDVPKGQEFLRIDKYLMNMIPNATRNKIQNAATAGDIYVNDLPVKSNYKVIMETLGSSLKVSSRNFFLSSNENIYFFSALTPMAITISSNKGIPLLIMSSCPNVMGSNDPGNIAFLILKFI
jgi:hypothetical protein